MGHQQPHHQREERPGELGCGTSERNLELASEGCIFLCSTMRPFIKPATTLSATSYDFPSFQYLSLSHFFQEATLSVLLKDELADDDLCFCVQAVTALVTMSLCCNQVWMWCVCVGLCRCSSWWSRMSFLLSVTCCR